MAVLSSGALRDRLSASLESRTITDVVPYGLGPLLENPGGRAALAMWIDDLHARGARIVLPIAATSRLVALDGLFREHPASYVDGVITELEFWNAEDREAAFAGMLALVSEMRARRSTWGNRALRVGAYLGYPTDREAARLASELDFVFLNYSVTSPERAWSKTSATGSLRARYAAFRSIERWPIFYATGEVDMKPALASRGPAVVERVFVRDSARDRERAPEGFAYFTFEAMP
ncbi:MAG: hypothetical protein AB7T06_38855 [Kofleriaceae bacterium]